MIQTRVIVAFEIEIQEIQATKKKCRKIETTSPYIYNFRVRKNKKKQSVAVAKEMTNAESNLN
jgi:hypothetical protein